MEHDRNLDKIKVIVLPTWVVVYNSILYLASGHFSLFMEASLKDGIPSENQLSNLNIFLTDRLLQQKEDWSEIQESAFVRT